MFFLFIGIIFFILFAVSFKKEKRLFRNAVYLLCMILNIYCYAGVILMSGKVHVIKQILSIFLFLIVPFCILITSILFIISGVITVKREGFKFTNLLSIFFGAFGWIELFLLLMIVQRKIPFKIIIGAVFFCVIATLYIGFTFIALLIYSSLYCILPKKKDYDYVIVHGAGLSGGERVTPLLAGRLDKGIEAFKKFGSHSKLIVSGGQGRDEKIPEAEAMKNYLLEKGIKEDSIICENKSKTTFENLKYSKMIMDSQKKNYKCIFVTSNYHVFRTGLYAKKIKLNAEGLGCRTALYYWPTAFIREYIAIMCSMKRYSIFVLGAALFVAVILTQL